MKRETTIKLNWILHNLVPPILIDSRWFMRPLLKMILGSETDRNMDFPEKYAFAADADLTDYYNHPVEGGEGASKSIHDTRDTDLNRKCLKYILEHLIPQKLVGGGVVSALEVGCGKGFVSKRLADLPNVKVTAVDIGTADLGTEVRYVQGSILGLPFEDKAFDACFTTHTLEHIIDYKRAIAELVRVTRHRIIIVVPKEREYKYRASGVHVNFLPYMHSFQKFIGYPNALYLELGGDFLCVIDLNRGY